MARLLVLPEPLTTRVTVLGLPLVPVPRVALGAAAKLVLEGWQGYCCCRKY